MKYCVSSHAQQPLPVWDREDVATCSSHISSLLIASEWETTFQKLSRKWMQCSSKLRLMHWHLYTPLPPLRVLPTLALFFPFQTLAECLTLGKSRPRTHYIQPSRKRNQYHPCHSDGNVTVLLMSVSRKKSLAASVSLDGLLTDLLPKIAAEYMDRLCCILSSAM